MRLKNYLGGMVDSVFLSIPRIFKPLLPKNAIDRQLFEKELDFYIDNGFVNNPASFFTFPEKIPAYTVPETGPYHGGNHELISFQSAYQTISPLVRKRFERFEQNKTGYIIRWTHGDAGRKTVLCLHGFMLGDPRQAAKMFQVRRLFSLGLDVALFITPFHWLRAPESSFMRGIFLQPQDPSMTCECFGQTMHDLYISFRILQDLGSGDIGLIGASLGGYSAGLFIGLSNLPSFAALIVPAVNMSRPFGPDTASYPFEMDQELLKKASMVWELHSPLHFKPQIAKDSVLIIASQGDRLCPFEHVLSLCEKWQWPEHQFLTGGHWLIFNNHLRGKAWYTFLREKDFIA